MPVLKVKVLEVLPRTYHFVNIKLNNACLYKQLSLLVHITEGYNTGTLKYGRIHRVLITVGAHVCESLSIRSACCPNAENSELRARALVYTMYSRYCHTICVRMSTHGARVHKL